MDAQYVQFQARFGATLKETASVRLARLAMNKA